MVNSIGSSFTIPGLAQPATASVTPVVPSATPQIQTQQPAQKPQDSSAYSEITKKASASSASNYPISSTEFSFYKDASGKVITRYVSLIDGSVTYEPTPTYIRPTPPVAISV